MLSMLDVERIRADFPILGRRVRDGKRLIYFDNAATTQKPKQVIDAIYNYYMNYNANIHRAVHQLSEEATEAYEGARAKVARFIDARSDEVVFVRNATEAINLVAYAWGRANIRAGDTILVSEMEHHSNIVPWQMLAREKGARLHYIRIDYDGNGGNSRSDVDGDGYDGSLVLDDLHHALSHESVKLVAISHMSNVLGTINPVEEIVEVCRDKGKGTMVLVDGAQSAPHMPIDVKDIGCDFFAFSAHKMLGPTGVGVLYAKRDILDSMHPFIGGGDMIREVHKYDASWNDLPWKFEAGTPNIADVIGFGAAIDYLSAIGMENIRAYEHQLTEYMLSRLRDVKGLRLYGSREAGGRGAVFSFNLADIHPHDLATILDEDGIAIRSGHHCAQPLMERLGVAATSRASLYIYNTREEIDRFIESLERARLIFRVG
ncbi:MAG: cysteine desulfurase [Candidatus Nitrosocaldus sp.]|nr:cysteine desulfurase [Candidatus Nitrosocaldus sp.]